MDVLADLRHPLPLLDESVDHVLADNVLEHFDGDDLIAILNELDRVLKEEGTLEVIVPKFPTPASVQDPTHKSFFTERSILYWNQTATPYGGRRIGITANFYPDFKHHVDPVETFGEVEVFLRFRLIKLSRGVSS